MNRHIESPNGRRNFLRGRFSSTARAVRPPWALIEQDFLAACTRCADCLPVCPNHILRKGDGGYPVVDFSAGECTFCAACIAACQPNALQKIGTKAPWTLNLNIAESCLAAQRVECRVCGEMCERGAIHFAPQMGSVARPVIEAARCNSCGACVAPCPTQAIHLTPPVE